MCRAPSRNGDLRSIECLNGAERKLRVSWTRRPTIKKGYAIHHGHTFSVIITVKLLLDDHFSFENQLGRDGAMPSSRNSPGELRISFLELLNTAHLFGSWWGDSSAHVVYQRDGGYKRNKTFMCWKGTQRSLPLAQIGHRPSGEIHLVQYETPMHFPVLFGHIFLIRGPPLIYKSIRARRCWSSNRSFTVLLCLLRDIWNAFERNAFVAGRRPAVGKKRARCRNANENFGVSMWNVLAGPPHPSLWCVCIAAAMEFSSNGNNRIVIIPQKNSICLRERNQRPQFRERLSVSGGKIMIGILCAFWYSAVLMCRRVVLRMCRRSQTGWCQNAKTKRSNFNFNFFYWKSLRTSKVLI